MSSQSMFMTIAQTVQYHLSQAPVAGGLGYLAAIYALHRAMATRKAASIPKPVMVVYNFVQVAINLYVALAISNALQGRVWGLGMPDTPAVRHGVYLHYLCKYLDMIDTVIIAARKKGEQLSFLHLYHHSTIVIVWGWVVNTWPADQSAVYAYGAWVNSWVHVIMYFYYGLTAMGIRPPFKKWVTVVQLTQFASCITHAITALFLDTTPVFYNAVQVCYHIQMLKLFLPLLLRTQPAHARGGKGAAALEQKGAAAACDAHHGKAE